MSVDRDIKSAIQVIAGTQNQDKVTISVAKVKSVDEDKSTCLVVMLNNKLNVEVPNVNLQVGVCDGLQIIPKIDSDVLIVTSTYNQSYIIQYSDIDKVYLQVGDSELTINNDGTMQLNDGSYDGLVKVSDLKDKLNNLENKVNDLITALQGVVIPLAPSGTYPFSPIFSPITTLTPTQQSEIENEKIKHGTI
jgi:hypothetical protein